MASSKEGYDAQSELFVRERIVVGSMYLIRQLFLLH